MAILGYPSVGNSTNPSVTNDTWTSCKFTAGFSGAVTDISVFTRMSSTSGTMVFAIYSDNAGAPDTVLWSSPSSIAVTTTPAFYTQSVSSFSVTAGTTYWLTYWCSDTYYIYADAGSTNQAMVHFSQTYPTWQSPFDGTNNAFDPSMISIFLTISDGIIIRSSISGISSVSGIQSITF